MKYLTPTGIAVLKGLVYLSIILVGIFVVLGIIYIVCEFMREGYRRYNLQGCNSKRCNIREGCGRFVHKHECRGQSNLNKKQRIPCAYYVEEKDMPIYKMMYKVTK